MSDFAKLACSWKSIHDVQGLSAAVQSIMEAVSSANEGQLRPLASALRYLGEYLLDGLARERLIAALAAAPLQAVETPQMRTLKARHDELERLVNLRHEESARIDAMNIELRRLRSEIDALTCTKQALLDRLRETNDAA